MIHSQTNGSILIYNALLYSLQNSSTINCLISGFMQKQDFIYICDANLKKNVSKRKKEKNYVGYIKD